MKDKRGFASGGKNKISDDVLQSVLDHINKFPRYKSHYCRETTEALFLHPDLTETKIKVLSKDTCNTCDRLTNSIQGSENAEERKKYSDEHDKHLKEAETARSHMKNDFSEAKETNGLEVISFDMEKVLPLPRIPTNIVYYKRQLSFYNEGIHSAKKNKAYSFVWKEGDAGSGAQEVSSCIKKYIEDYAEKNLETLILCIPEPETTNLLINMSYKNRTQRIFANLNLQTNLIGGKPKVRANITETQPETTANKDLNPSQNNVSDFMPECILKPSNTTSGNLQTTLHVNEEHLSQITPSSSKKREPGATEKKFTGGNFENNFELSQKKSKNDTTSSDSEHEPFGSDDSVKDPTYNSSLSNDDASSEEKENNKVTKKRKIKIKIERPQKALQPPCGEKCKLKCSLKIVEEERLKIFNEYWGLKDLEKQRQFISSNMQTVNLTYKYSNAATPRNPNNAYYFIITINNRVIQTVLKKHKVCQSGKIVEADKWGKHNNHYKVDQQIKNEIREHIKSIPRIDSHYCRSHTSKEYIEGCKTLADLHRDYLKICEEKNLPVGNYHMYRKIFEEEFNIAFYVPKKDQCDLCLQFKNSTETEKQIFLEKYERHIKEKELSRKEKENDKKNGEITYVIVFDLQAVLPCPVGYASSFFYVSKLNVEHFFQKGITPFLELLTYRWRYVALVEIYQVSKYFEQ
ncbi:hypothetical protein NQ314_011991 [Rhamnusium bicolor]|uniref:Uncharacterized protein n=1 Tax=Rhamnusium bicolor TaxID=1586634 RepID=A0AAV8XF33_9CUCU|nr:hypothetical protein NQ314_011991 [Rhamnusium bicolor]